MVEFCPFPRKRRVFAERSQPVHQHVPISKWRDLDLENKNGLKDKPVGKSAFAGEWEGNSTLPPSQVPCHAHWWEIFILLKVKRLR